MLEEVENLDRRKYVFPRPKCHLISSAAPTIALLGVIRRSKKLADTNNSSAAPDSTHTTEISKWMKALSDHLPLSALSIPGTHNSPTYYRALPSVRCQAVSPIQQLENGVRFLDVRLQVDDATNHSSDALQLVHGVFPISFTGPKYAKGLLETVEAFLERNPSETVILCLKREGRGNATDAQLADRLITHYIDTQHWHTKPGIPNLGEVRGKIVLMRRFGLSDRLENELDGKGWGFDATNWGDNSPNHMGGHIAVQDFYEVLDTKNIDKKIQLVCDHLERASAVSRSIANTEVVGPLFINFLSASNFWTPGCWPDKIAAKLNPAVDAYLWEKQDAGEGLRCTGIVVCDWVGRDGDWGLVRAIIDTNSSLRKRESRDER